jgi:hypothetical protein
MLHLEIGDLSYDFEALPVRRQSTTASMKQVNVFFDEKGMFNLGLTFDLCVFRAVRFAQRFMSGTSSIGHIAGIGAACPIPSFWPG